MNTTKFISQILKLPSSTYQISKVAHETWTNELAHFTSVAHRRDPTVSRPYPPVRRKQGTAPRRRGGGASSPAVTLLATKPGLPWSPWPSVRVELSRWADDRREVRRRRPWRLSGVGRRRYAGGDHGDAETSLDVHLHTTTKLPHPLLLLEVVGDAPATASARSGEALAMAAATETANGPSPWLQCDCEGVK